MKRVLCVDYDETVKNLLEHLNKSNIINVDFCEDYESGIELYDSNKYYIVFVDFSLDFGNKVLNHILNKNPNQRVITACIELTNGETAYNSSNNTKPNLVRLLKPVDMKELIAYMKDFDFMLDKYKPIDFSTKSGIISQMKNISRRFRGITYDEKTKTIISYNLNNLIEVVSFLNKYDIDHRFNEEKTIEILN